MANGYFVVTPRTRFQRALRVLFPHNPSPPLEDFPGSITSDVVVAFDWKDRLRLLVRPCLVISVRAYTELPTGRALRTDAAVYVPAPGRAA